MAQAPGARSPDADSRNGRPLFLMFFIGGGLLILVLKGLSDSAAIAVLLPVVLMSSYCFLLVEWPAFEPRYDFAGDNFYYLGFLYTLISLGLSLFQFNASGATSSIVSNFGLALVSTILGLAGRIVLSQSEDAQDVEERTRRDLARANRRLRAEMEYAIAGYQAFRAESEKTFEELEGRVSAAGEVLAESVGHLEEGTSRFAALQARAFQIDEAAASAVESIGAQQDRLASETQRVSRAFLQLVDDFRAVDFRREFVEELIAPTSREFGQLVRDFTAAADRLRRIESDQLRVMAENAAATSRLVEIVEENRRLSEASSGVVRGLESTTEALLAIRPHLERYSRVAGELVEELVEARRRLHDAPARLEEMNAGLRHIAQSLEVEAARPGAGGRGWGLY